MKAAFEDVAQRYDVTFTNTLTGRYQRAQVWQHLDEQLYGSDPKHILEVNCGTGEDAIYMAGQGHKVLATDVSAEMIQVARLKLTEEVKSSVTFEQMNMLDINTIQPQRFDVIFSNFGGLNCLSPNQLDGFLALIPKMLKPKGRFIAVVMPKFCLIESLYFFLKLDMTKVFRRNTKHYLNVQLLDETLPIWYYSPKQIRVKLSEDGTLVKQKGIGIFIPPSYLDAKFSKFRTLMRFFGKVDSILAKLSLTANFSDHFLIDIEMKK